MTFKRRHVLSAGVVLLTGQLALAQFRFDLKPKPESADAVAARLKTALAKGDVVLVARIESWKMVGQTRSLPPSNFGKVTLTDVKVLKGEKPGLTFNYSYVSGRGYAPAVGDRVICVGKNMQLTIRPAIERLDGKKVQVQKSASTRVLFLHNATKLLLALVEKSTGASVTDSANANSTAGSAKKTGDAEDGEAARVTPVLTPDPEVIKIIDSLGDGESALLPKVKTTGAINDVARTFGMHENGPGARDFSHKMAWMPDRERAIFFGANHGAPHRTTDVWEHDLPSNTWVCLHAPENVKGAADFARHLDPATLKGVPATKTGAPATPGHTWWNLTYDPEIEAMLILNCWSIIPHKEAVAAVHKSRRSDLHRMPLWAYYPESRKWKVITNSKWKGRMPQAGVCSLEYVPELKKPVFTINSWKCQGMWTYDAESNTWEDMKPNGGDIKSFASNFPGMERVVVYVPDRKMLVAHLCNDKSSRRKEITGVTSHYSFETNAWMRVMTRKGDECWGRDKGDKKTPMPIGNDHQTPFVYDQVGKVCLLVHGKDLWAYDPGKVEWTKITPRGPAPTGGRLAYYDAARNVFVINGRWVYRHKRTP